LADLWRDAEPRSGFFVGGPFQHPATGADQQGQVFRREIEIVDQLSPAIARAAQDHVGIGIAGQECLQPQQVGRAGAAEQDGTDTALQETHAPEDEGTHDELTELRGPDNEGAQPGRVQR
jgi:hypothetical protein